MTGPTKPDEPTAKPKPDAEADKVEDMATQPPVKQMDNMGAAIDAAEKGDKDRGADKAGDET